jgi:hypothetical protein
MVNCVRRSERKEELAENMQAKEKTADNITYTMREERKRYEQWERQGEGEAGD